MMKKYIPVEEGDFYHDPSGYRVFTAQYHLKKGIAVRVVVGIAPMVMTQKQTSNSTAFSK